MKNAHQLHAFEDIHAHPDSLDSLSLTSRPVGVLGKPEHLLDCSIPHRGTVTLQDTANEPEKGGHVKDVVPKLLLNQSWVEYAANVHGLSGVL